MDHDISVIIPVRNRDFELERAINSVLMQSIKVSEVIVIDDCSDIDFYQRIGSICAKFESVILIRNEQNRGAPYARNRGARAASCPLIAFLDSDDTWHPKKLELQLAYLKSGSYPAVFSLFRFVFPGKVKCSSCKELVDIFSMLDRNILGGTSSVLIYKTIFFDVSGFNEELRSCQDWDLWLRLINQYGSVYVVQEYLVDYYSDNNNRISKNFDNVLSGHEHIFSMVRDNFYYGFDNGLLIESLQKVRVSQVLSQKFDRVVEPLKLIYSAYCTYFNYRVLKSSLHTFYYILVKRF